MDVSSISPGGLSVPPQSQSVSVEQAAQRRELIQAAKSVNDSGILGRNQLVFLLDSQTHRPIIRVEDRETHEIVLQIPAEYVLRLAQDLRTSSLQSTPPLADT
jgi:flagellar protein FlaG